MGGFGISVLFVCIMIIDKQFATNGSIRIKHAGDPPTCEANQNTGSQVDFVQSSLPRCILLCLSAACM